ncbi:MAG: hypothetical protein V8R40_00615 [Dysosmobacter sp.]
MVLLAYLKRQWKLLLLLLGIVGVFAAVFSLYDLPLEAVGYAAVLCLVLGSMLFVLGFWRFRSGITNSDACWTKPKDPCCRFLPPETCWNQTTRRF